MLVSLEPDKKSDWKKYLPLLTYAYNCTKHETTKISPYEIMFGRKPRLPIDSMFDTPVQEVSNTTKEYVEELKKRMKTAQDIAQTVTEEARIKIKTVYERKARAPKIHVGDKVLVKILTFEGKHKMEDRLEDDIYTVVGQPNREIPIFDVRSDEGVWKRLHRNHIFLLRLIGIRAEDEDKVVVDDNQKEVGKSEEQEKDDRKSEDIGKTPAVADDQSADLDPEIKHVSKKDPNEKESNLESKEQTGDNEYSDDDDSEIEFVVQTHPTGDAWTSGSHLTHDEGPVLQEKKTEWTEENNKEKKT